VSRIRLGLGAAGTLALGLVVARCAGLQRAPAEGASVLLVTIDTLRADRVGAYGNREARTPTLDGLAARGLLFEEALASTPLTLPSHATILSGLEPPRHGVRDNGLSVFPDTRATLATLLKTRGYATGAFVGAYVLDRRFGLARGFDRYDDRIDRRQEGVSVLESERRGEVVVEAARAWLAAQAGPFFAWVHLYDPHAPYDPPSPWREEFAGRPYEGEVAYADACLGRLLSTAEERTKDRLLIAVLGDHGEGLGEHGERTHGFFVYQSTLRIPLLIAGPGLPRGERRPGPARTADVLPTLLGRLGLPIPAGLDGKDLLAGQAPREMYAETAYPRSFGWAPVHALRVGSLKYIEVPRPELYDLRVDPRESRNLITERPEDAAHLRASLAEFRGEDRDSAAAAPDPEVVERLRALGYVASAPEAARGPLEDPKDALGLWRTFEEATWAEGRGEEARALGDLQQLVEREPGNVVFRRSLAAALRRAGRPREAVATLADVGRLAPDDAVAWHEKALALAAAGRLDEAAKAEARAVALNPLLPEPHNHLGVLEARRGRPAEALRRFEEATALDPNNAKAWNNRANALRALGRRSEAEVAYRKASELAPRDPDPANGLGVLLTEAGSLDAASVIFERLLALDPAYGEARLNLAVVEAQRGHPDAARALVGTILRQPGEPDLHRRARALLKQLETRP
jgi:arylsulfatase A-like enzyme/Flp pilus assembly protein TadD